MRCRVRDVLKPLVENFTVHCWLPSACGHGVP